MSFQVAGMRVTRCYKIRVHTTYPPLWGEAKRGALGRR